MSHHWWCLACCANAAINYQPLVPIRLHLNFLRSWLLLKRYRHSYIANIRSMWEAQIRRRKRARDGWASTCTCHLFFCGQLSLSDAFQICGRISQFWGQLRDHVRNEVIEAYGFVNPKHINNPTPENLEAAHERNRALIASIKNSFWYRVSYSAFFIQVS